MPVKDQNISIINDNIHIYREKYGRIAFTSYTPELYESLKQTTWSPTADGYMTSKMFGTLHKHVMSLKYGKDVIEEAYKKDFVIDHINNNGFDCLYSNLEIIPRKLNAAKGLTYDKEREKHQFLFALNFSKDPITEEFQISIGFNKPYNAITQNGVVPIASMYLRYGKDYKTTFLDAQNILNDLVENRRIEISKIRATNILIDKAIIIKASPEELEMGYVIRDGQMYVIQGSEQTTLTQLSHKAELHKGEENKNGARKD